MKAWKVASLFVLLALAVTAFPAFAGTVNMQFNGTPTGNNYYGVPSYPYDLSVNGGPNQWMMCLGYNEHISGGETWQATSVSIASLDPNTHPLEYQAAFLFMMAVADYGSDPAVNAAVWYLFEGVPSLDSGAQTLVTLAQGQTFTQGEFANVVLYTAIPGTESYQMGTAQNFLGTTPEPGTLAMFGSGLIGFAGLLRRKLGA
jgi:PEP-CTERM motif